MRIAVPLAAAALAAAFYAPHQPPAHALRTQLDAAAPQWLKDADVPSVAVAYIENGAVAWTTVHGDQSPGVPASSRTLYNVASLTKPVAAEAILRLTATGAIDLDESMSKYWVDPDIAEHRWHHLLTPRLSLTHQTGFTNWRYQTGNVLTFRWEPGTQTGYSGEGYDYVARFAEKKLGRDFESLVQDHVLDPIGMKDTSLTHRAWHEGRVAQPRDADVRLPAQAPASWTAADLLHTTVDDYARFVVSVMRNDRVTEAVAAQRTVLARNQATAETTARVCAEAGLTGCTASVGMGLGWEVLTLNGVKIVRHSGADPGYRALALFVPERNVGIVCLTSGTNGKRVIAQVVALLYPDRLLVATL